MVETSFILFKPDAYKNVNILPEIYQMIKNANLERIEATKVLLNQDLIDALWPAYKNCPITKILLYKYLDDEILDIWIISGENANEKLKKIKKEIRKTYSLGCFANVLHTPLDIYEAEWQIELLSIGQINNNISKINNICKYVHEGLFGNILNVENKEMLRIITKVWKERGSNEGNEGDIKNNNSNMYTKGYKVILNDENNKTIDYVMSSIYETIDDCSIEDILNIVLDADSYKKAVLKKDTLEHCREIYMKLKKKYGLNVSMQGE